MGCAPISLLAAASRFSSRPVMATFAPAAMNALAIARPMPLEPPVTNAVAPVRFTSRPPLLRHAEISGEVVHQFARVVFGAVNETRLATPQDRQAQRIEAGRIDDAAVVAQLSLGVEDRHVEPAVVRAKPGRPDDRLGLALPQVELQWRRIGRPGGFEALRSANLGVAPVAASPLVEGAQQTFHLQVSQRKLIAQSPREQGASVADRRQTANDLNARGTQRVEIQGHALGRADELR